MHIITQWQLKQFKDSAFTVRNRRAEERQISMRFYYIIKPDTSNQWIQVLEQLATSLEKLGWSPHFCHQNKLQMD